MGLVLLLLGVLGGLVGTLLDPLMEEIDLPLHQLLLPLVALAEFGVLEFELLYLELGFCQFG